MRFSLLAFLMLTALEVRAESLSIEIESFYDHLVTDLASPAQFVESLETWDKLALDADPGAIAIDLLWDLSFEEGGDLHRNIGNVIDVLPLDALSLGDRIRTLLVASRLRHNGAQVENLRVSIAHEIERGLLDKRSAIIAYSHQAFLKSEFGFSRIENLLAANSDNLHEIIELGAGFEPKAKAEIKDLVFVNLNLAKFGDGRYQNTSKIIMFCRHDRNYPCRYVLKNKDNFLEKNSDGSIWTQPSLAQSARGLPYNVTSGYTPSGVFTIDSVMPAADKQTAFGKFRRFILNFVPRSKLEEELKMTLPPLSQANNWWKESVVARDAGRSQLRIHGTGKHNDEPESTFYPHVKTSGCVSQLEGLYPNRDFRDQRNLLDMFMISLGLPPKSGNEPAIRGLLYVVEVDDFHGPVLGSDIVRWLDL